MMRVKLTAAAVALGALLGCDAVYSSAPMGGEVAAITGSEWEGAWYTGEGVLAIHVVDEDAGEIMVSYIDDGGRGDRAWSLPRIESHPVYLRSSGNWLLASRERSDEPGVWEWARVKKEGDLLILWTPEASAFEELVAEGALPGTVEEGEYSTTITLGELSSAHYELITGESRGVLVDWDDPEVLVRIRWSSYAPPPPPPPPPPRPPGGTGSPD